MFLGHYAVGLAAKKVAPKTSLGALFLAAGLLDFIWPIFLLLGWEEVDIIRNVSEFNPLYFSKYPYSHSLLAAICWAGLFAAIYFARTKYREGAIVCAFAVVSHWVLDFFSHRSDMPITPWGDDRYGLGLWNSKMATALVEGAMFVSGLAVYLFVTRKKGLAGLVSLWSLIILLLFIYVGTFIGPPPPNTRAIALVGFSGWLVPLWGYWIDRNREVTRSLR